MLRDVDHQTLPVSLSSYLKKVSATHSHETRQAAANKYRVNRANTHYEKKSLQIQGSEFLNNLKNTDIYNNALSKSSFLKSYKKSIIESY